MMMIFGEMEMRAVVYTIYSDRPGTSTKKSMIMKISILMLMAFS